MRATVRDGNTYRVWVNGEEVTNRCVEAATETEQSEQWLYSNASGYVILYALDENGNLRHDGHQMIVERLYGDVQIEVTSRA